MRFNVGFWPCMGRHPGRLRLGQRHHDATRAACDAMEMARKNRAARALAAHAAAAEHGRRRPATVLQLHAQLPPGPHELASRRRGMRVMFPLATVLLHVSIEVPAHVAAGGRPAAAEHHPAAHLEHHVHRARLARSVRADGLIATWYLIMMMGIEYHLSSNKLLRRLDRVHAQARVAAALVYRDVAEAARALALTK